MISTSTPRPAASEARPLPDHVDLRAELEQLKRQEAQISAVRRRLHNQLDLGFPNDLTRAREREVSAERRALHERIDVLSAAIADAAP